MSTPLPDYEKQVYAAVLGKTIGVYMGRPFEGWWKRSIEPKWGSIDRYVNEDVGKPLVVADDDISGTFTFVKALSDWAGDPRAVDPAFFGETWRNYLIEGRTILWWGGVSLSTEHTAWMRLKRGVPSPESGSMKRNGRIVAEQIGAQIFIDAFGMVAPGDPDLAERFADGAARVSHDGEAVLAAKVVARMVAAAFVEKDMEKVLDIGAATLPPDSLVAQVHRDVRAWAREDGDWRRTYDRIFAKYGYDKYGGNCHVIPNHAVMVMAWSYAGSDFFEAQRIVNTAGWDTDCNAANVGTVSALVAGLDHLCDRYDFRTPFADRLIIPTADGTDSVTDCLRVARRIAALGRRVMGWGGASSPSEPLHSFSQPGSLQGWMFERPKAVLFDLDGTLLDTLPGLAASVNAVLRAHGEPERSLEEVRAFVGNGVRKLVARAAKGGEDRPDYTELLAEYRAHYLAHAAEGSAPYPGVPELLAALRKRGVKLGVVTNKDEDAARALMERFFPGAFDVVLGGNAGRAPKPDPATPRAALEALGVSPAEALYVGDTDVDAATARGAGMDLRLCSWGFRARGDLEKLDAMIVDTPSQLLAAFESHAENAEFAESESHAESAENAEFDSHAENAEPNGGTSSPSEPSLVTRHSSLVTAKRALRVRFAGPCRLSTPVSVPAGQSGSYSTPNAPWLYRGMTATVRGRAGEVPAGAALRPFVRHAGGAVSRGEPLALTSGAPFELRWTLDDPAVPSAAILDFGLEVACEAGSAPGASAPGTIFVDTISYDGSVSLDYGDEWNPSRWSARIDGWIDGMDRQLGAFSDDPEPQRRFGSDGDPCVYVTGNRSWGDQTLRCRFNVHAADRAGVVLRWQGMRRHYAFLFEKERALLVRQDYGETVLAERPFALTENEMVDLEARAEGARLSLRVNGEVLLEAEDAAFAFATGGAGFYAQQGILGVAKPSIRAAVAGTP